MKKRRKVNQSQDWRANSTVRRQSVARGKLKPKQATVCLEPICANKRTVRLWATMFVLGCGFVGMGMRLWSLQIVESERWAKRANQQQHASVEVQGARGDVLDRRGRPLAVSVPTVSLAVHPRRVKDPQQLAEKLAPIIKVSSRELESRFRREKPFVWIRRELPIELRAQLKEIGDPSLVMIKEFARVYPEGSLAGPLLGRVSRDGQAQAGIELAHEGDLTAPNRRFALSRDARGGYAATREDVGLVRASAAVEASPVFIRDEGRDVALSVDSVIQSILEEELVKGVAEAKAKSAFGAIMDVETGEILALAQVPSFDPNKKKIADMSVLRNRIFQDSFEPGSTMKALIAAVALQETRLKPNTLLNCEKSGRHKVGRHTIHDVHPVGKATFRDALVRSSNICFSKIGAKLGAETIYEYLKRFGFGARSAAKFPGEASGILRNYKNWREIDVATHSFGHGVSVTAVQLLRAYASLANGGKLVEPTLERVDHRERVKYDRVFSPEVANAAQHMLYGVTEDDHGTGKRAKIRGLRVAGKTGTAEKLTPGKGYDQDRVLSSFIGSVDARMLGIERGLAMVAVVDEPGVTPRWGGRVAAPIFQKSIERTISYLLTEDAVLVHTARARTGTKGSEFVDAAL